MSNVIPFSVKPFTSEELTGMEDMTPGERLKALREKRFATAKEAAEAMGINPVTYSAHEINRGTGPSLPRYARFFHVSVDFFFTGRHGSAGTDAKHAPVVALATEGVAVKGYVSAGDWQSHYKPDDNSAETIDVAVTGYSVSEQFALQIRGESMNRRAKAGSYAICVDWDGHLKAKDVLVFELRRGDMFIATIKVVGRIRDGEVELLPDSDHPNHQDPIYIRKSDLEEGDEFAIVARVLKFVTDARQ